MNGEEKHFFEVELTRLKTQFDERWDAHDKGAKERAKGYWEKFDELKEGLKEIFGRLNSLPCGANKISIDSVKNEVSSLKKNDLKHINIKINALLFTVLGSVFIAVIIIAIRALQPTIGG